MDKDIVMFIIGLVIVAGIAIVAMIGFCAVPVYLTCQSKAEKQGLEFEWGPLQGCMVKTENGWMDYDRIIYKKDFE